MWYIFKAEKCLAKCNYEPNADDLATREEIAIESGLDLPIIEAINQDGVVVKMAIPEPTAEEIKQQQINRLNQYYPGRLSGILEAIQQATALGNSTAQLTAKYQQTFAEYKNKMAELVTGA